VVTEGNYVGVWPASRARLDRLYDVDRAVASRRASLVARHVAGGRSAADAEAWVDTVDEPNAAVIAASRAVCDRLFKLDDHRQ
jgi:guanyl-specific ribonuclease Sa